MTAVEICDDKLDRAGQYAGSEGDNPDPGGDPFRLDCVKLALESRYDELRVRIESDIPLQKFLGKHGCAPLTPDEVRFCIGFAAGADASARNEHGNNRDKHIKKVIADRKKGPPGG